MNPIRITKRRLTCWCSARAHYRITRTGSAASWVELECSYHFSQTLRDQMVTPDKTERLQNGVWERDRR